MSEYREWTDEGYTLLEWGIIAEWVEKVTGQKPRWHMSCASLLKAGLIEHEDRVVHGGTFYYRVRGGIGRFMQDLRIHDGNCRLEALKNCDD